MHHLAAFYASIDSATPTELNTIVDDVLTRSGATRFSVPRDFNYIQWAAALGPNVTRARLDSPTLGVQRQTLEIHPRRRGGSVFTLANPELFLPPTPIPLTPTEELSALAAEDASGASAVYVLVALGPATQPNIPSGQLRIIRAIGATTLTPNQWTTVAVTPEQSIEPGTYELVGFIAISATAIAARAIITGQVWRPGLPALAGSEAAALTFNRVPLQELMFEPMGSFDHQNFPQFQFLSTAADTAETVYLYVIKR
jgi:hypothetical protein